MTYEEYKLAFAKLTPAQVEWLKAKCQWEHMSRWAVLESWTPPPDKDLKPDGTHR